MKLKAAFCAWLIVSTAFAADSLPVFNALLSMGQDNRFVLVSPAGKTSGWLKLGDSFDGYAIKSYDASKGVLEVSREGKNSSLTLANGAGAGIGKSALPGTPATLADAEELFRVMRFDEMMSKMLEQQKRTMAPMIQQMVSRMNLSGAEQADAILLQKKVSDEMMNAMMGPEMKAEMAKVYSEVFTKEELGGIGDFYATPTGQSFISKQPEAQQKMMAVMMPRMTAVMPKIQQMTKDFAAEIAAKRAASNATAPATTATPVAKP